MKKRFCVTYEIVTPESAEHGDYAEHGWTMPGGWHDALRDASGDHDDVLENAKRGEYQLTLREALAVFNGYCCEDNDRWLTEGDGRQNYRTGAEERRSLHLPDSITEASRTRVVRLVQSGRY